MELELNTIKRPIIESVIVEIMKITLGSIELR
jgi:hypothetical protein